MHPLHLLATVAISLSISPQSLATSRLDLSRFRIPKIFGSRAADFNDYKGKFQEKHSQTKHEERSGKTYSELPFMDISLPWDVRVDDLVNRLTLEEIIAQTMVNGPGASPAIPRLGIKPYMWMSECNRGQSATNTTAFPQSLGLAAAFSEELMVNMSRAISYEMRARNNENNRRGVYPHHEGLSCYSPVINIMRHPLWGRNQETYGEDPYLSGMYAHSFVLGLQGDHPRYKAVTAGCKHFDVHGGPENIPSSRFSFNSKVSIRDWRMTFLPQFKKCIEAGSFNLMCSFNSINGVPACANKELLTDIARTEYGFHGYVVSDSGALEEIVTSHHYLPNMTVAAAAVVKAGCNQELTGTLMQSQLDAFKMGLLTEEEIRNNVKPLFYTRMRLGDFDPDDGNPYTKISMDIIQSSEHRELATRAASMTFVLLKNDGNVLPLRHVFDKIAVVGPFSNTIDQLFGDYSSDIVEKFTTTVYEGIRTLGREASLAPGCSNTHCLDYNRTLIEMAVKGSQVIFICLGTGFAIEMEGTDRSTIDLPGQQLQLLKDAVQFAPDGARVVLLLFNAGPLDIGWAKRSERVHAILECFFPAQATGAALYRVLTGSEGPAGRLPATWPTHTDQVAPITDYTMRGRTYRYYNGDPLYPFGYGLSYSTFQYSSLSVQPQVVQAGQAVYVDVSVTNTGSYPTDEVIQIYLRWHNRTIELPWLQLVGFRRQFIRAGETRQLNFAILPEQTSVWLDDETGFGWLDGVISVYAGGQQPYQKTASPSNILHQTFKIIA